MRVRYHKDPKKQRINNVVAFWMTRICAPLILLVGLAMAGQRLTVLTSYESATGTIVGAAYDDSGYSHIDAVRVSSKVRFTDATGENHAFDSDFSTTKSDEIGRTVTVRYDPARPGDAVIVDFWDFWFKPVFIVACAVLLWLFGSRARTFVPPGMDPKDVLDDPGR